mmetsp:Transcript_13187/g.35508  ORF Transcript_13187/g.35508 Transcript_13187/m.35508 type:complete len:350 (-) Transcript_13187:512-1561(-)
MEMDLYSGAAGWALPCLEPMCTAVLALLRAHEIPVTLHSSQSPAMTALHELPVLHERAPPVGASHTDAMVKAGLSGIRAFLRAQRLVDWSLTPAQLAECDAFSALIASSIAPLEAYERMLVDENYSAHTRTQIASELAFPSSWIVPMRERGRVRAALTDALGLAEDNRVRTAKLEASYDSAKHALAHLSARLGSLAFGAGADKLFYSGGSASAPSVSSLDAVLFGHLAAVLYSPFEESRLRELIAAHPSLVSFCHRMRARCFPECDGVDIERPSGTNKRVFERTSAERAAREAADRASQKHARSADSHAPLDPKEQARKRRNQIFVAVCVGSFVLYALDFVEFESFVLE